MNKVDLCICILLYQDEQSTCNKNRISLLCNT